MMKMRIAAAAMFLVAGAVGGAANARAQSAPPVAGRILGVQCDAHLKRNGSQAEVVLRSPQDIGLGLSAGDQVECIGAGYVEILIAQGSRKIVASQKWFSIPPLPVHPQDAKEDSEIANSLKSYGVSGATRGQSADSRRILWPAENCAVLLEHFEIRWKPIPEKITLSILSESKDVAVWGPTETDGGTGNLKSDAISAALAVYKQKSGSEGLVLTLTPGNSNDWEESRFSLLNRGQQQELDAQLDFWEKHSEGLALRLGRGYSYSRHKLFAEAAEEYDSALSSAPESLYLLGDAIRANQLAGRVTRVRELQSRAAAQPQAVNP
jgi:hypothetical protein